MRHGVFMIKFFYSGASNANVWIVLCASVCSGIFLGFWQLMFFRTSGIGFLKWTKTQTGPSYDKRYTGGTGTASCDWIQVPRT